MSEINPTKSQIIEKLKGGSHDHMLKYYTKYIHRYVCSKFIKAFGHKPSIDNANDLISIFEHNWSNYYRELENEIREKKYSKQFYDYCNPLNINVKRSVYGFISSNYLPAENIRFPLTFIVEGKDFENFKEYIKNHSLELKNKTYGRIKKKDGRLGKVKGTEEVKSEFEPMNPEIW